MALKSPSKGVEKRDNQADFFVFMKIVDKNCFLPVWLVIHHVYLIEGSGVWCQSN